MLTNSRTFILANSLHDECTKLKLPYYLRDQILRSSSSVALNISEGYGKSTYADQRRYFHNAMGSLRETQGALILAKLENSSVFKLADHLGASLYRLIKTPPR